MVDDESKPERRPAKHMKTPEEWDLKHNPAYAYYAFYTYANLYTLNKLREARGLNTFALRPHAGPDAPLPQACSCVRYYRPSQKANSTTHTGPWPRRVLLAHASLITCAAKAAIQTIEAQQERNMTLEH